MNIPKCLSCKAIMRRVQHLLEEIRSIRSTEVYAICDHCRFTRDVKCKRCQYFLLKFKPEQKQELEEKFQNFKQWLSKLKELLQAILTGGHLCKYGMYQNTADVVELENLLGELYTIKDLRQPENEFPSRALTEELSQSKDMVREVIQKFRAEGTRRYSSDDSLFVTPSKTYGGDCTRGVLKNRVFSIKTPREVLIKQLSVSKLFLDKAMDEAQPEGLMIPGSKRDESKPAGKITKNVKEKKVQEKKVQEKKVQEKKVQEKKVQEKKVQEKKGQEKNVQEKKVQEKKVQDKKVQDKKPQADKDNKALKMNTQDSLGGRMKKYEIKNPEKATKVVSTTPRKAKVKMVASITYQKQKLNKAVSFENILECREKIKSAHREMIRGLEIVPYDKDYLGKGDDFPNTLFFNSKFEFESKEDSASSVICPAISKSSVKSRKSLQSGKSLPHKTGRSGVILYQLSDKKFIDNGWTLLPTSKILRRMNIYKMQPAKSYNWFGQNRGKGTMFYATREKLAEINEDGSGCWFYKNGLVALEYYDTQDPILMKRFTVYSDEVDKSKEPKVQNVLACFDYNGNGIVYDNKGNERLKFNQSEGYIFDSNIGTPGRWKWHTLNEPPVYCRIYEEETLETLPPELEKLMQSDTEERRWSISDEAMSAIELQNVFKEKAEMLKKKYKAFEIRMKTVKINDYFSLKVNDQANVYLLYRDGVLALKLNLGMILLNEIIATEEHDADAVTTPYDRSPLKPRFLAEESPMYPVNLNLSLN